MSKEKTVAGGIIAYSHDLSWNGVKGLIRAKGRKGGNQVKMERKEYT